MNQWIHALAGTGLMLLGGVAHGLWSNRWGDSQALDTAAKRLQAVPAVIGDWSGRDMEMDPKALAIGEIVGHVYRRYEDRRTGQAVLMLLVCGKAGPIAVHTPDVCYGGIGFTLAAPPTRQSIPTAPESAPAAFWSAKMSKQSAHDRVALCVWWTWNASGRWEAPDNPRLQFGRFSALYKLYVVRELSPTEDASAPDPAVSFLQQLVPELQRTLEPDRAR